MINNIFNKNNLIFIGCLVYGFFNAFFLRQEFDWDLINYHYYNVFALLNDRWDYDIVVGSVNTFFNPLLDIPLYYMIQNFNDFPRLIFGIQGLYFGVCLFFFIKICGLFWNVDRREGICATAVAVIIAITGEAVGCQIGTSTNEIQVIAIFIPALYLLLKILIKPKLQKSWKFLAVGVGMGIALGLKQTVIIYCLSSGLTTIILYKRLKQGQTAFGKDYFRELLERVRSIRASERRIYQQITDIFAECSIDYDKYSPITQETKPKRNMMYLIKRSI